MCVRSSPRLVIFPTSTGARKTCAGRQRELSSSSTWKPPTRPRGCKQTAGTVRPICIHVFYNQVCGLILSSFSLMVSGKVKTTLKFGRPKPRNISINVAEPYAILQAGGKPCYHTRDGSSREGGGGCAYRHHKGARRSSQKPSAGSESRSVYWFHRTVG